MNRLAAAAILSIGILSAGEAAAAEPEEDVAHHIYSAGHKALFMCSGVFVAGRDPEEIRANEIAYAADFMSAPGDAELELDTKSAVGTALSGRIVRRAAFREGLGCTLLAPDAGIEDIAALPAATIPRASGDPSRIAWPDGDLLLQSPLPPELNLPRLNEIVEQMFDGVTYRDSENIPAIPNAPQDAKTAGVVVVYKGNIVAERYSDGWGPHTQVRTYSAAKSLANALIGIRVRQGALSLDTHPDFPEWGEGDPRRQITIRNLLHMSSGLNCGEGEPEGTLTTYFGGGRDAASFSAQHSLIAEPGSRWCYSNYDTIMLGRAIRFSLPSLEDYLAFPHRELFMKIGMRNTFPETDAHGNFILSSQIWTTPRDLARFGLLYLQDGVWNGERILPENWVEFTRSPSSAPAHLNAGEYPWEYGAQFWLFKNHPRLPSDTYTAAGHNGNYATIIPSLDLVVVRMGLREVNYEDFLVDIVETIAREP